MLSNLSLNKRFTLQSSDGLLNQRINARLVKLMKIGLCCLGLLLNSFAFALAPVVDAYDDDEDEDADEYEDEGADRHQGREISRLLPGREISPGFPDPEDRKSVV